MLSWGKVRPASRPPRLTADGPVEMAFENVHFLQPASGAWTEPSRNAGHGQRQLSQKLGGAPPEALEVACTDQARLH